MNNFILESMKLFGKRSYRILPNDIFHVIMKNNNVLRFKCTKCIHSKSFEDEDERFDLLEAKDTKNGRMYAICINYYLFPKEREDYKKSHFEIIDALEEDIF